MTREQLDEKVKSSEEMARVVMVNMYHDRKRVREIRKELVELKKRIRQNELSIAEYHSKHAALLDIRWMLPS